MGVFVGSHLYFPPRVVCWLCIGMQLLKGRSSKKEKHRAPLPYHASVRRSAANGATIVFYSGPYIVSIRCYEVNPVVTAKTSGNSYIHTYPQPPPRRGTLPARDECIDHTAQQRQIKQKIARSHDSIATYPLNEI